MEPNWSEKKKEILNKLLTQKQEELAATGAALEKIKQTAIEAPGRMESRYDSTKQEYSYLVNDTLGAFERIESEIKEIKLLSTNTKHTPSTVIENGSLIRATLDGQEKIYLLLTFGSGEAISDETIGTINIISTSSPIGEILLNKSSGAITELNKKQLIIKEVY